MIQLSLFAPSTSSANQIATIEPAPAVLAEPASSLSVARTPDPHDPFEQGRQACRKGKHFTIPGGIPRADWDAWEEGFLCASQEAELGLDHGRPR